mmetsp:Transcript_7455/g.28034  ORF Transcript_7455/g.28034 Transcript_7455/m.28034 type:complete len:1188 (-) Transcript_7455:433-3996(-)
MRCGGQRKMSKISRLIRRSKPWKRRLLIFFIFCALCFCFFPWFSPPSTEPNEDFIQKSFSSSRSPLRVAIVMPIVNCQILTRVKPSLEIWKQLPPGRIPPGSEVSVIFHYNKFAKSNPGVLDDISHVWKSVPMHIRRTFRDVRVWSADLSDQADEYPLGPCEMFHRMFPLLRLSGFTHWFQYEPDVRPIRSGWLSQIVKLSVENKDCELWWQLGSEPVYHSVTDYVKVADTMDVDLHINGNALYCVRSAEFDSYRSEVRRIFPRSGCDGDINSIIGEFNGWDHALYRYRHTRANRAFKQHSKFRLDPLIRNFGTSLYTIQEVRVKFPNAFLVHGKNVIDSTNHQVLKDSGTDKPPFSENLIQYMFWRTFGRQPSQNEMLFWFKLLDSCRDANEVQQYMVEFQSVCHTKVVSEELLNLFDSEQHAAIFSGFATTVHRLPYPQELNLLFDIIELHTPRHGDYVESLLNAPDSHEAVGLVCELTINMACKAEAKEGIDSHQCGSLQAKVKSILPAGCVVQHISVSELTASCDGIMSQVKNPLRCVLFENVNKILVCTKSFTWNFPSYTPHLRSTSFDKNISIEGITKPEGFEVQFRRLYKGTKFTSQSLQDEKRDLDHILGVRWTRERRSLWVTDFHASPSMCNSQIFSLLNADVNAKIDFGNCEYFRGENGESVCASDNDLKVLAFDNWNGFGLHPCPSVTREAFFLAYRDDPEFSKASAVICSHPVANCELYMPFKKPIILYATTRLEFGRNDKFVPWRNHWVKDEDKARMAWTHWLENMLAIASNPSNIIAANNLYDSKYIEYFTGIKPLLLPSWCGPGLKEMGQNNYRPTLTDVLLTPYRTNLEYQGHKIPSSGWPNMDNWDSIPAPLSHAIFDELFAEVEERKLHQFRINTIRNAFPSGYKHVSDLKSFPVFLFIPYQASVMSFFELYRLNVPMLVPSKRLLIYWMAKHKIMFERVYGQPEEVFAKHRYTSLPSPNSFAIEDAKVWVNFYDIYQEDTFPHLLYFDTWKHALDILSSVNLAEVATAMTKHNEAEQIRLTKLWENVLSFPARQEHFKTAQYDDFEGALFESHRVRPPADHLVECEGKKKALATKMNNVATSHVAREPFYSKCDEQGEVTDQEQSRKFVSKFLHPLTHGAFASACSSVEYDAEHDLLACDTGIQVLFLRNPYSCSDIRLSLDKQLLCF